jgi:hypothetical protein
MFVCISCFSFFAYLLHFFPISLCRNVLLYDLFVRGKFCFSTVLLNDPIAPEPILHAPVMTQAAVPFTPQLALLFDTQNSLPENFARRGSPRALRRSFHVCCGQVPRKQRQRVGVKQL